MLRSVPDRVFLFGAGASYGAGPTIPENPPLGPDLFEALAKQYWHWEDLRTRDWMSIFASDFEQGMGRLWKIATEKDNIHAFVAVLVRDMARFFSAFEPRVGNAYLQLVEALEAKRKIDGTIVSTLNYECMLESALSARGGNASLRRRDSPT